MTLRLAELCAGYGGLGIALGLMGWPVELAWYAEYEPPTEDRPEPTQDAAAVMAHHHPGVPNLWDITTADWIKAEPVDVLTAGWPCQPYSLAGKRKGDADERAIWRYVADAVRVLRPRVFLGENVPGIFARGQFAGVVRELAAIGYVGSWVCVRASDTGAPHRRDRLFVVAYPANTDSDDLWNQPVPFGGCGRAAGAGDDRQGVGSGVDLLPTPGARLDNGRGSPGSDLAADRFAEGRRNLDDAVALLPTPTAREMHGAGQQGREGGPNLRTVAPSLRGSSGDLMLPSAVQPGRWGRYTAAIQRWERILGRPAPEPTEPGRLGAPRLSARFVEWLMAVDEGYVTDVLPRNPALRVLGNGVVPTQAAMAFRALVAVTR